MCRALTPRIITALDNSLDDPRTRVGAASILLERGYGKVAQPIEGSANATELTLLHLIAARQIAEQMHALVQAGEPDGANGASHNGEDLAPVIDLSMPALE